MIFCVQQNHLLELRFEEIKALSFKNSAMLNPESPIINRWQTSWLRIAPQFRISTSLYFQVLMV
ncbi:MAG: hypothetical protein CBE43_05835 [Rhodopirellula sp. TMED283]|nr:MAG: hypothetical protein CBE43_05835 [Rhodopirellula sp. TMED283]